MVYTATIFHASPLNRFVFVKKKKKEKKKQAVPTQSALKIKMDAFTVQYAASEHKLSSLAIFEIINSIIQSNDVFHVNNIHISHSFQVN